MPEICRFLGIVIKMFYNEHNPPHFHVEYNKYNALISIKDFALLNGKLPPKIHGLVIEWASKRRKELLQEWELSKNKQSLIKLKPLE